MTDIYNRKDIIEDPLFNSIGSYADSLNLRAYVVGGYVRDKLLGFDANSPDIDVMVVGDCQEFTTGLAEKLNLNTEVKFFKNFGTAMLRIGDFTVEFVSARKESYLKDSRKPLVKAGSLDDDLLRRDFTINALAVCLNKNEFGSLIDIFKGLKDIENKIIRTPADPRITFSDDPLRMLRAIRFACQLDYSIDSDVFEAICSVKERIKIISKERIISEINKMILSGRPSYGFKLLQKSGLLKIIFPELDALNIRETINQTSYKNNFYHTLEVLDNVSKETKDLWLRWAAILHDIAKPLCKQYNAKNGWTFHGHEIRGAKMVPKIFRNLKLPLNEKMKFVQKMVFLHMRPIALTQETVTDSAIRRLLLEAGQDINSLMLLCNADITTANSLRQRKYKANFQNVVQKLQEVEERDKIKNWKSPISGYEIQDLFKITHGREIGTLKNLLKESILEGHTGNNRQESLEFILTQGKRLNLERRNPNC